MSNLENLSSIIWDDVCKNITLILQECDLHGLAGILTGPNPSIESRIVALKKLDVICQLVIDGTDADEYSVARNMYNAKQQILNLEMLLSAAKNNDENEFNKVKGHLNGQSNH